MTPQNIFDHQAIQVLNYSCKFRILKQYILLNLLISDPFFPVSHNVTHLLQLAAFHFLFETSSFNEIVFDLRKREVSNCSIYITTF